VLKLAPDLGYPIEETRLDINDILRGLANGEITEAFGLGTAAVVAPVSKFGYKGKELIVGNGDSGPVARHLFQTLTDIQYGRTADPYGWTYTIEV
jgi:branched-chain amino acid aminotransferase